MRRRFVLVSVVVTVLVVAVFAVPLAWLAYQYAYDRAMSGAEREVVAVGTVLAVDGDRTELHHAVASTSAGRAHRLTVHLPGGTVAGPPGWAPGAVTRRVLRTGRGETLPVGDGVVHLHPTRTAAGGVAVVEILVPDALLHRGVHLAWAGLASVSVLLVVGAAVLADRLAAGPVRATRQLARAAGALGDGDLTVRVVPDGPPEIASAGAAFNDLVGRVAALLAAERELVADLSHRLRTPLTALRLGVEALPDGADKDRLSGAAEAVEEQVDAVITRAREPLAASPAGHCDLRAVVGERVAYWAALAEDQDRSFTLGPIPAPVMVPVPDAELCDALDSLLGNIFRHTPEGTGFAVRVATEPGRATVTIDDAGPGIPVPPRRGRSDSSTGLGLSIARRVAEAGGGTLTIGTAPLGGARFVLSFATPGAPPPR
ncbi:two-component sensor histidine kinase [Actinocatenispora thailandica]|uniref:Signal transduction histidine-protein kinase/phosphatase MprB n=1 Tax=Actinocatenispora thailandica TaxID=227318 RepID=A0A7R7DJF5_9ACTN|nr:HAMP domain-containing sensor histidine kinase [Actinocatenispora thailandica]BCJ32845.1 two-component sensor histidine kinase [Actinocatenispora thailandica]